MRKTLSVAAIENGTVIDHIPAGQGLRIIHLLGLLEKKCQVTVGLNLPSHRLTFKDLIKIENHVVVSKEANEITIFAPQATINVIKNFEVSEKIITSLPSVITEVFACPNPVCITHGEPINSHFKISEEGKEVKLTCVYCEKKFDRNEVEVKL